MTTMMNDNTTEFIVIGDRPLVLNWLEENHITYELIRSSTPTMVEKIKTATKPLSFVIAIIVQIEDPDDAMLFKLAMTDHLFNA